MGMDIRLPIGGLFGILGALLMVYGLVADPIIYQRSLGYNVNLWWGAALLLFGVLMLYLARRGAPTSRPAELTPGGRETEEIELREGLERENPTGRRGH